MSCFGLVLHSVGAESCCGVVRQCKDFAMEVRNLVARSLCCARSMEVQVDGGILDAKRGFAGRNIAGGLFSAESCCAGIKSVIKPLYQTMEVKNAKN